MSEILELIQTYTNYLGPIIFSFIAIAIITVLADIVNPKMSFLKFIPGLGALLIGVIIFIGNLPKIYIKDNIPTITIGGILIGCGIVSLCIAVILGIIRSKDKKAKDYTEYEEY